MEPEEYIEYFEDTILSRTSKLDQKGVLCKGLYWAMRPRPPTSY